MPFTPPLPEHKEGDAIDLTKGAPYPSLSLIGKTAANAVEHIQYKNLVNNAPYGNLNRIRLPNEGPEPTITQDDIDDWRQERPDLPNIPVGLPRYVGEATVSMYDNDKNLARMSQIDPGMLTKIGMFGGSFGAGLLDPINLLAGFGVGGLAEKGFAALGETTIAKNALERMASSSIFGSSAARTATQVAQSGGRFAAFNVGSQISEEAGQIQVKKILDQPVDYIQSLQNIGYAGMEGLLLGSLFGGAGRILLGERVKVGEATTKPGAKGPQMQLEGSTVEVPAQYERRGGLLNRPEFQNIPQRTKEIIGKVYRPWSRDANTTMTEEAVGQMANGQTVDVGLIMKQGMVEEGENFRAAMKDSGVDVSVLDQQLSEAQNSIIHEMSLEQQIVEEPPYEFKRLSLNDKFVDKDFFHGTGDLTDISEFDKKKSSEASLYGQGVYITDDKIVARQYANLNKHDSIGNVLQVNFRAKPNLIDVENEPKKDILKIIKKSAKSKADIKISRKSASKNIDAMLKDVKRQLEDKYRKKGPTTNKYGLLKNAFHDYADFMTDLNNSLAKAGYDGYLHTGGRIMGKGKHHNVAVLFHDGMLNKKLVGSLTEKELSDQRAADLWRQHTLAQSLRDHINDTHEPVSNSEIKEYSDRLRSPGIPETPPIAEPRESHEGWDIDNYLEQYSPDEVKSLSEQIGDKSVLDSIERNQKRLSMLEKYREMAGKMVDCILKGTL